MSFDPLLAYFRRYRQYLAQDIYKNSERFKEYARFDSIKLSKSKGLPRQLLSDALMQRNTTRLFDKKGMSKRQLGDLLFWAAGITGETDHKGIWSRNYPSGGAGYGIEIYPLILNVKGIQRGVYHYNVKQHIIEHLHTVELEAVGRLIAQYDEFALMSGTILLLSLLRERAVFRYGALSYKLLFLEAGHISQNIYLLSPSLGLGCCSLGMNHAPLLNEKLRLDGINESIFYGMAVGKPAVSKP